MTVDSTLATGYSNVAIWKLNNMKPYHLGQRLYRCYTLRIGGLKAAPTDRHQCGSIW